MSSEQKLTVTGHPNCPHCKPTPAGHRCPPGVLMGNLQPCQEAEEGMDICVWCQVNSSSRVGPHTIDQR